MHHPRDPVDQFRRRAKITGIRKFRVGFTVLHQYGAQLSPEMRHAVTGNVGNRIAFRVGGEDAHQLQRSMDIAKLSDFTDLEDYNFIAQLKHGRNTQVFRSYTEPVDYPRYGNAAAIRSLMRTKFARPVAEIEAQYERWMCSRHYGAPLRMPDQTGRRPGLRSMRDLMANQR